jgi:uncharacterized protein YndB with AHSA1/START domain
MMREFEKEYRFKAKVERVWEAFTDPSQVAKWMGRRVIALELRPGGRFEVEGLFPGEIREVEPLRRLVWAWDPDNGSQPIVETITLHPHDDGTRVVVHALAHGRWAEDLMFFSGVEAGWEEWLEALDAWMTDGTVSTDEPGGLLQAGVKAEEVDGRHRLYIQTVKPGGVAEAAGIQVGDTLKAWNGQELTRVATFWRLFWRTRPGERVTLTLERNGEPFSVELALAARAQAS